MVSRIMAPWISIPLDIFNGLMYDEINSLLPAHPASSASNATKSIEWMGEKHRAEARTRAVSNKAARLAPLSLNPPDAPYVSQWAPMTKGLSFFVFQFLPGITPIMLIPFSLDLLSFYEIHRTILNLILSKIIFINHLPNFY